mmetsp:Transcript_117826/g.305885  ORF Transcript_117826/g.305885 Transcript_117826/m.305885 type:complete len:722 (-) Transcript_117826:55-2220(-)
MEPLALGLVKPGPGMRSHSARRRLKGPSRAFSPRIAPPLRGFSEAERLHASATAAAGRLLGISPQQNRTAQKRPVSAPRMIPGAFAWLQAQPDVDERRAKEWLHEGCGPAERALRRALRQPASEALAGRSGQTRPDGAAEEVDMIAASNRVIEKLKFLSQEVEKTRPSDASVLQAARLRIQRLRELQADAAARNAAEIAKQSRLGELKGELTGGPDVLFDMGKREALPVRLGRRAHGRAENHAAFDALKARSTGANLRPEVDIAELGRYLSEFAENDEQRAWSLFCWICIHIECNLEAPEVTEGDPNSAQAALVGRACSRRSFAQLYLALALNVGLQAVVIHGHCRGTSCSVRQEVFRDGSCAHTWNAVKVKQNHWIFVDCELGAGGFSETGFQRRFCPFFFGPAPEELAFSHLPLEMEWQLLVTPLSRTLFVAQPIVSLDAFFGNGLSFYPDYRPSGLLVLKDSNTGSLRLRVPQDVSWFATLDGDQMRCLRDLRPGNDACRTIHFRTPLGAEDHRLEVFVRRRQPADDEAFSLACTLVVAGPAEPKQFSEPYFPKVCTEAFLDHGLFFHEALPAGSLVLRQRNQVSIQLGAPLDVLAMAEVVAAMTGEVCQGAALVQRAGVVNKGAATSLLVTIQCPVGEHWLRILVKRRGAKDGYREAVIYRVFVSEDCQDICTGGLPASIEAYTASGEAMEVTKDDSGESKDSEPEPPAGAQLQGAN